MTALPVTPAYRLAERTEERRWLVTSLWSEQAVGIIGGDLRRLLGDGFQASLCGMLPGITSIFLGRKLGQQARPIAGDDAADFVINDGDHLKFLDLPTNHFKIVRAKGASI